MSHHYAHTNHAAIRQITRQPSTCQLKCAPQVPLVAARKPVPVSAFHQERESARRHSMQTRAPLTAPLPQP